MDECYKQANEIVVPYKAQKSLLSWKSVRFCATNLLNKVNSLVTELIIQFSIEFNQI